MLSPGMRQQIKTLLSEDGRTVKGVAKMLHLAPKTVRRIRDDKAGHQGRKGDFKPFLEQHASEIRNFYLSCEMRCPPLRRLIKERFGQEIPLRTLQRHCKALRKEFRQKRLAENMPIRYETQPGEHLQIDFGEKEVLVGGKPCKIHVFVGKLGYSRRIFAKAYAAETQDSWLDGLESAFRYFGGVPACIVCDNASSLVRNHYARQEEDRFTERFYQFCRYYRVTPIATAVRKPRSKGKVESAVKYVKMNALVGVNKPDLLGWNLWLEGWCRESDNRKLNTVFSGPNTPRERWLLEEPKMRKCTEPPMIRWFTASRKIGKDGLMRVDNKYYRVPSRLVGQTVQIQYDESIIKVMLGAELIVTLDKTADVFNPPEQESSTGDSQKDAENKRLIELQENPRWQSFQANQDALVRNGSEYDVAVGWSGIQEDKA